MPCECRKCVPCSPIALSQSVMDKMDTDGSIGGGNTFALSTRSTMKRIIARISGNDNDDEGADEGVHQPPTVSSEGIGRVDNARGGCETMDVESSPLSFASTTRSTVKRIIARISGSEEDGLDVATSPPTTSPSPSCCAGGFSMQRIKEGKYSNRNQGVPPSSSAPTQAQAAQLHALHDDMMRDYDGDISVSSVATSLSSSSSDGGGVYSASDSERDIDHEVVLGMGREYTAPRNAKVHQIDAQDHRIARSISPPPIATISPSSLTRKTSFRASSLNSPGSLYNSLPNPPSSSSDKSAMQFDAMEERNKNEISPRKRFGKQNDKTDVVASPLLNVNSNTNKRRRHKKRGPPPRLNLAQHCQNSAEEEGLPKLHSATVGARPHACTSPSPPISSLSGSNGLTRDDSGLVRTGAAASGHGRVRFPFSSTIL